MRRSRWKTNKGILALLLSALMVTEPIGAAITVHAEERVQTPQVTDLNQTQEPGTDGTLTDDTKTIGQEPADGSVNDSEQNKDGQEKEEDRNTEEGSDGSSSEDTDKKDETTENAGGDEGDDEQVTEPGEEDPDAGEELDEENPDGEELDEDEKAEDEELEEDPEKAKEDEDNKALGGFTGMPDDYKLSTSQIERKRSIAAHIDDVEDFQEGSDYAERELVTSAESIEEAEMIARAYNAEIIEFSWGILTLKLDKDFSVEQAVRVAADAELNMPAVWPNYLCYTSGEEPVDTAVDSAESIEIEMSEYEASGSETVVEEDSELSYSSALSFNDPYLQPDNSQYQYHHEVIGSSYAWAEGHTGDGIKVAVLDTGMNSHNDLPNVTALKLDNMSEFYPEYGDSTNLPNVNDIADSSSSGHGTHVAGIIAATADNNSMGAGVAPGAQLFIGKALPNNGGGNVAYAMRGVRAAKAQGVDIINMSLGSPGYHELFQEIIDEAYNDGIAIFAAAGNDSRQDNDYPACYNHVISVAATDRNNERASFSNYNKMVDLSAPGVAIWSTSSTSKSEYVSMDGTSMACPVAAGEAAVILSANDDIYNMIRNGKRVDALEKLMKANTIKAGSGMGSGITSLPKVLKLSTAATKPGAPEIDIKPDDKATAQKVDVTIKAQSGMTIYYTINGKNPVFKNGLPDEKSETKKYMGKFSVDKTAKATIKAIAVNGSGVSSAVKSASYTLKPYVTGIEISGIQEVMLGKSIQLKATVTPAYATNKKVDWKLLNEQGQEITGNVGVTINTNGKVTATKTATVGKYTVQVTAKDQNQKKSDLYHIEVIDSFKVNKISFKEKNVTLTRPTDVTYDLWTQQAVAEPVKENDVLTVANFKWSSSNDSVATVSSQGKVTPLKAGTVTITALANDSSNKKATFKVTVKQLATGIDVTGPNVLAAGKSGAFKAQVLPADTSNKKVSWELWQGSTKVESGEVTINAGNGKVTVTSKALAGKYKVKAIASDGSTAAGEAEFEVASGIITKFDFAKKTDSKVTLCRKSTALVTGKSKTTVDVAVEGTGTPNWDAYTVTSSNSGIATATAVRNDQTITLTIKATGNAAGKTNIVLASTDGSNKKLTCAVTVVNPISSIAVAPAAGCYPYVVRGKTLQLKAVINTEHGAISNKNVDWKLLKEDGTEVSKEDKLGIKIAANGKISMDKNAPCYKVVGENTLRRWYTAKAIAKDGSEVYGTCKIYVGTPTTKVYVCDWDSPNWEFGKSFDWTDTSNIVVIPPSYRLPASVGYSHWFGVVSDTDLGGYTVSSSNSSVLQVEYIPETDADGYAYPDVGYIKYTAFKKGSATITLKPMDNSGKQVKYTISIK